MSWFGKKREHKLPKFPPNAASTFKNLCVLVPESELALLKVVCNKHFDQEQAEALVESNQYNFIESEDVQRTCTFLLDQYYRQTDENRKLIVGAVRYAALSEDPFDDHTFASGMTDDKQILNYVLEELDIHNHYLKI